MALLEMLARIASENGYVPPWARALITTADSNRLDDVKQGVVVVPTSAIFDAVRELAGDDLSVDALELTDRAIRIAGTAKRAGIPFDLELAGTEQAYDPGLPIGTLSVRVEEAHVRSGGGPIRRLFTAVVLAVLRAVYGPEMALRPIGVIRGVQTDGDRLSCNLAEVEPVTAALDRRILGLRVGDLFVVANVMFTEGAVEVHLEPAEILDRMLDRISPKEVDADAGAGKPRKKKRGGTVLQHAAGWAMKRLTTPGEDEGNTR